MLIHKDKVKVKVKQILNIPEEFDVLTIIPMVYPMNVLSMHEETDRLPVEDLMNFEKFTGLSKGRIMVY